MSKLRGDFALQLGSNPDLSKFEFARYFKDHDYGFSPKGEHRSFVLVHTEASITPHKLVKNLGGIVRVVRVVDRRKFEKVTEGASAALAEVLKELEMWDLEKLGFSLFEFGSQSSRIRDQLHVSTIRPWIKRHKLRLRMVTPSSQKGFNIPPAKVVRKKLLKKGAEIVLIKFKNEIIAGYTEAITDPALQIKKDEHRVFKLVTHGSSVRFAQILVNLADIKPDDVVLDPFCGTGTILQEALIRGANVLGLDIEEQCVQGTKKNLASASKIFKTRATYQVLRGNAKAILDYVDAGTLDAVITEPYLGPFQRKPLRDHELEEIMRDLQALYQSFLRGASKALKPGGRVVFVTPRFVSASGTEFGFIIKNLIKRSDLVVLPQVKDNFDPRQPVPYGRESNKIGRDVWVLYKKYTLKV